MAFLQVPQATIALMQALSESPIAVLLLVTYIPGLSLWLPALFR